MANPSPSDVNFNPLLTDISVAWMQNQEDFIATRVFPRVPVQFQAGSFLRYKKEDWYRIIADIRGPGAESVGGGWDLDTDTYYAPVIAVHHDLDDQTKANAMSQYDLHADSVLWVSQQILLKLEVMWAQAYYKTSVWSTDITGVDSGAVVGTSAVKWNLSTSDPITDLDYYRVKMAETTGHRPNVLVLSPYVFTKLKNHPLLIDRIKYTEKGILTKELLAAFFDVERVEVPWGVVNTVRKGVTDAAANYSFIFGKDAFFAYVPSSPGLRQPASGYTFIWSTYTQNTNQEYGMQVASWYRNDNKSERIEGEASMGTKVVAADLGVFFSGIVD